MMELRSTATALAPGLTASFKASGGLEPYSYAVVSGGSGGTINSVTGEYTAPYKMNTSLAKAYDSVMAVDANADTVTAQILVAEPLFLFCEILQKELGLENGRVFIYNQKIMQPTDDGMFITVSVLNSKAFGTSRRLNSNGDSVQSVNMMTTLSINVMSRSTEALMRKEEVILALSSLYSEAQQDKNSFNIAKLPAGGQFVNLSDVDGAAIPYRFNISVNMQYFVTKNKPVDYFDNFTDATVVTEL